MSLYGEYSCFNKKEDDVDAVALADMLFGGTNSFYWLATRFVHAGGSSASYDVYATRYDNMIGKAKIDGVALFRFKWD